MTKNSNLHAAKKNKQDEFYTQYFYIDAELSHYRSALKGKTVYCNCDNPYMSQFFAYFVTNFRTLGLKKLVTTCYDPDFVDTEDNLAPASLFAWSPTATVDTTPQCSSARMCVITTVPDDMKPGDVVDVDTLVALPGNSMTTLHGNGSFDSPECLDVLEESDVVVTNPPFSILRHYIDVMMEHNQDFLIIAPIHMVHYNNIFSYFRDGTLVAGVNTPAPRWFYAPGDERITTNRDELTERDGDTIRKVGMSHWFTTMVSSVPEKHVDTTYHYTPDDYPTYDNCPAIEVPQLKYIPCDYFGIMGVPITIFDKLSRNQFTVLGTSSKKWWPEDPTMNTPIVQPGSVYVNGKEMYKRIFIRYAHPEKIILDAQTTRADNPAPNLRADHTTISSPDDTVDHAWC